MTNHAVTVFGGKHPALSAARLFVAESRAKGSLDRREGGDFSQNRARVAVTRVLGHEAGAGEVARMFMRRGSSVSA
jgi:hypothetical protein